MAPRGRHTRNQQSRGRDAIRRLIFRVSIFIDAKELQRIDAKVIGEQVHRIKGQVPLASFEARKISRRDIELRGKAFLSEPLPLADSANVRAQPSLQGSAHTLNAVGRSSSTTGSHRFQ